jgi:CHU domain-containing protein
VVSYGEPFVSNVVTANNDAKNDTFIIDNPLGTEVAISIVNRWGDRVYETVHYQGEWPDTEVSSGVYYYTFTFKPAAGSGTCPEKKGWIHVIR